MEQRIFFFKKILSFCVDISLGFLIVLKFFFKIIFLKILSNFFSFCVDIRRVRLGDSGSFVKPYIELILLDF
jgi:hypothetical protein